MYQLDNSPKTQIFTDTLEHLHFCLNFYYFVITYRSDYRETNSSDLLCHKIWENVKIATGLTSLKHGVMIWVNIFTYSSFEKVPAKQSRFYICGQKFQK